jgi:cell wall-associated NlpC family hydrolase
MAINPLQAATAIASPRACVGKKVEAGVAGFQALLQSLTDGVAKGETTPQAAAELLRIKMMQSSLALSGDAAGTASSRDWTPPSVMSSLDYGLGLPTAYRSTAALETAEAEESAGQSAGPAMTPALEAEVARISETAAQYIGTPYRFGGEGGDGIDCSSFVQQVFHANRIDLPRTAREQINVGNDVAPGDLRKGDLVFFQTYASYPSHVGIYLGDGKMIHASSGKGEVTISDMDSDYYRPRYLGAKRVI